MKYFRKFTPMKVILKRPTFKHSLVPACQLVWIGKECVVPELDFQLLRDGDEAAWAEMFRRLWPVALRVATHELGRALPGEVEDAAAEALEQLVDYVHDIDSEDQMRARLVVYTRHQAMTHLRRALTEKRDINRTLTSDAIEELVDANMSTPFSQLARAELIELLGELHAALKPSHARVLYDNFYNQLSYKEIAAKHGIPIGTVGAVLHRSLRTIRKKISKNQKFLQEIPAVSRFVE